MGPLDDKGFIDNGLLVIGPEKDCHLVFLLLDALYTSSCGYDIPPTKGRGNWVEELGLLLSLCPERAFKGVKSNS